VQEISTTYYKSTYCTIAQWPLEKLDTRYPNYASST